MNINEYKIYKDFYDSNGDFIYSNTLLNHFLIVILERVIKKEEQLRKLFDIVDHETNNKIIVVLTQNVCLLYGNDCNQQMIETLSAELEYPKFKRYRFAGNKKIITDLLATNDSPYNIEKDRNVYECGKVVENFNYANGGAEMGSLDNLEEITQMSLAFSKEYEAGEEIPTDMRATMWQGIMKDNLYVWRDNEEICSILQVIQDRHDYPEIGNFYTKPELRRKGYGASLIHLVTKGLLENGNEKVILTTNAKTPGSNIAFQKAGYKKVGDYFRIYKTIKEETGE